MSRLHNELVIKIDDRIWERLPFEEELPDNHPMVKKVDLEVELLADIMEDTIAEEADKLAAKLAVWYLAETMKLEE